MARRAHYLELGQRVPRWVERGMGARLQRAEQVRHRVQMLLGVASAWGVLPLEFKPTDSVGGLLFQHLGELEQEAEDKGGILSVLAHHFTKTYRVALSYAA